MFGVFLIFMEVYLRALRVNNRKCFPGVRWAFPWGIFVETDDRL